jgi:fructose-1-phosphate kinase PfkB-like protein
VTLIVSPNMAVDRVVRVDTLAPGANHRADCLVEQAGGKGANVTRGLKTLGGEPSLVGLVAGRVGALIRELAADEGFAFEALEVGGESRISTVLIDGDAMATGIFEEGPCVTDEEQFLLLELLAGRKAREGEWAVLTGSAPPCAGPGFYASIARRLRERGFKVLVDASGVQLRTTLEMRPEFVKVNLCEAAVVTGTPIAAAASQSACCADDLEAGDEIAPPPFGGAGEAGAALNGGFRSGDGAAASDGPVSTGLPPHTSSRTLAAALAAAARPASADEAVPAVSEPSSDEPTSALLQRLAEQTCRVLVVMGAGAACVTLGPHGAVALVDDTLHYLGTPAVATVNPVGSGDVMAAGLVLGFERGQSFAEAAPLAVGAAAANAATVGTAQFDLAAATHLAAAAALTTAPA